MKPFGSISDFVPQRNNELIRAFRKILHESSYIKIKEVTNRLVNMPASRFWVSEERASTVVSAMVAGRGLPKNMRPSKREMFTEIYNRVVEMRKTNPKAPIRELAAIAVNTPAPKFYMCPRSALVVIYKIKNGYYDNIFKKTK
jgi:hypothetical protein